MEPTEPLHREAIDAYNLFIHGHIDRRAFMDRVKRWRSRRRRPRRSSTS